MKKKFFNYKSLILEISDDAFEAFLTIKDTNSPISEDDIISLIKSAGIKFGWENAQRLNAEKKIEKQFNKPFLIAAGNKPQINYKFTPVPEIFLNSENLTDFALLKDIKPVKKNFPLAKLEFSGTKTAGTDIFGNKVSAETFTEEFVKAHLGKNTKFLKEKNQIVAAASGFPVLKNDKISLSEEIIFHGNIVNESLNFFGNLKVEGNLINSRLSVNGNLSFHSAEQSEITVSGSIFLRDGVRFSTLLADGKIHGTKDSFIKGGLTQSGEEIKIGSLGSPFSFNTEVEITCSPFLKKRLREEANPIWETEFENRLLSALKKMDSFGIYALRIVFPKTNLRIFNKSLKIDEEKKNRAYKNAGNGIYSRIIENK